MVDELKQARERREDAEIEAEICASEEIARQLTAALKAWHMYTPKPSLDEEAHTQVVFYGGLYFLKIWCAVLESLKPDQSVKEVVESIHKLLVAHGAD